ncbi:MAG: ABC transporter permease, partial [Actinomycetota bacterium]|nr:ABC transporter permease [Actinomycetota bacterium]
AEVEVVADPTSQGVAAALSTIDGAVAREGVRVAAAALLADQLPSVEPVEVRDRVDELAGELAPVEVVDRSDEGEEGDAGSFSYITPANLTLFVFINTLVVSTILANDRKQGITRRLLAAPVTAGTITLGLAAAKIAFALVQATILVAIGTFVFRVHWGDPLAATTVVILFALVAAAIGLIVGARARDADQAQSIGVPISVAAGMLGGCMWPLEIVPDAMRMAGHVTPHAWAMDVWRDLVFDEASFGDVVPELTVLAVAAVVLFAVAARSLRRAVTG